MNNIIFIVGPTATGKSKVGFLLAHELKGEIISADSMLVYKEPRVITSKPSSYTLKTVQHYFIDIVSVVNSYNVFDYYLGAREKIIRLFKEDTPIIVCGGSGLYVKAILDGIFEGVGKDENLRKVWEEKAAVYGKQYLYEELKKVDVEAAREISPQDLRRIIRALEVYYLSGLPISQKRSQRQGLYGELPIRIFGLSLQRKVLYERIDNRVEEMFKEQAVKEVNELLKLNLSQTAQKIIGVKEIEKFLKGECDEAKAKEEMKKNTRHFAKRQLTWFKKDKRIEWIDIDELGPQEIKDEILKRCTKQ